MPTSYADFAALAAQTRAPALADVLRQASPDVPFASLTLSDKRTALTKFRDALKQETGVVVSSDGIGGTWGYQPDKTWGHRVYGFVELAHAILAAVRSVVAPLSLDEKLEMCIANSIELRWLFLGATGDQGSNRLVYRQRGRFRLFDDCRHYYHLPQASLLLQCFREPAEFAPNTISLAGYTFFGNSIVAIIEALHHGGGWRMIRWLQERHEQLIAHDVLHDSAKAFLERQGFDQVRLPFPPEAADRHRDMTIMTWPAAAQDPSWVQEQLIASGVRWWVPKHKTRFEDRPQEEQDRSHAFFDQMDTANM